MILMDESDLKLLILCTSMNSSCQEMGKLGHVEQIDLTLFRKRDSKVSRRESLQTPFIFRQVTFVTVETVISEFNYKQRGVLMVKQPYVTSTTVVLKERF